jgi:hypothetical protein
MDPTRPLASRSSGYCNYSELVGLFHAAFQTKIIQAYIYWIASNQQNLENYILVTKIRIQFNIEEKLANIPGGQTN